MAISNYFVISGVHSPECGCHCARNTSVWGRAAVTALCLFLGASVFAEEIAVEKGAARAEQIYHHAQEKFKADSQNAECAWKLAHACFEWAEFAKKDADRAALAEEGIKAARHSIQLSPKGGPGYHYLAMNLGQLARTRKLSALKLVDEMEENFLKAIELEPKLDYASPHRSVGLLYRDAPGWPISVGSKSKARVHLRKAVELYPDFPENQLTLLESLIKWGDYKAATNALPQVEKSMSDAQKKFSSPEWEQSWQDWKPRWEKLREKIVAGPKNLQGPKHRA
jgi:tetratricopeptide (TPR) repeat protein